MNKRELSRLYWLNREIEREKERLEEMRSAGKSTTAPISGLPHVSGSIRRQEDMVIFIREQEELVRHKIQESTIVYNQTCRAIDAVDDPRVREILRLRYINGLPWQQVAMCIGGGNTADTVRMAARKYVD